MTTMTATPATTATDNYGSLILSASLAQTEAAAIWYHDAQAIASKVASNLGTTLEVGASIVSAFSPRERWTSNVAKALAYSMGERPAGLGNNLRMADAALAAGFDALKGLKTNAFARAIAGDTNAVVIDVWMMRAAGMEAGTPNKSEYLALSESVVTVADRFGIMPRTAQALIWIIARGGAA
jgi:hypothetical protein